MMKSIQLLLHVHTSTRPCVLQDHPDPTSALIQLWHSFIKKKKCISQSTKLETLSVGSQLSLDFLDNVCEVQTLR